VGGFFLLRGGDEPVTFSLDAAVAGADDAPGRTDHIEVRALGQTLKIDGTTDTESGLLRLSMNLRVLLGVDNDITAVVDPANKVMYMEAKGFGEMLKEITDKKWVKIDAKALAEAGQDASMFDQLGNAGQVDVPAVFDAAKDVVDKGATTFEGEAVHHYAVVVDIADVKGLEDILQGQSDGLGGELPDQLTYDIDVTEDNQIRRVAYDIDLGVAKMSVAVVQHRLDTAPGIVLPPADDVIDARDLG
jgi:hypothetical protein